MTDTLQLTPAQASFADAHESSEHWVATHGRAFIYRERVSSTERWLVAPDGSELDWARFRRSPPAADIAGVSVS
jgi:hypothetical protein